MADSVRKQILQAMESALLSGSPPATVKRSLPIGVNLQPAKLPVFVLQPVSEAVISSDHDKQERTLRVRVICVVGDSANAGDIDNLTDPLLSWVEQKFGADETFGGLALGGETQDIAWQFEAGEMEFVGAALNFDVLYWTKRNDPTISGLGG